MTFKTVTRNYIRNSSCRAFTLVELLVVIAIISILVGLLMPAVMNAQNEARRAQCQENLRNVAMALVNYESSKNYFPGYISQFRSQTITWYTAILEQLGNGDLYKTIATGRTLPETHLSVLNCPSDSRIKCKQSYRINGGMEGAYNNENDDKKWRITGLSFDLTQNEFKIGASQIVDGAANTILVGENANNRDDWRTATLSYPPLPEPDKPKAGVFKNCLLYSSDTVWGTQAIINRDMDNTSVDLKHSRPSSRHRGVALVAFADTHVLALKDSIQYNTYKMIMCPNDQGCNTSLNTNIDISNIDNNYP